VIGGLAIHCDIVNIRELYLAMEVVLSKTYNMLPNLPAPIKPI
jgi:hypothetical protein